MSENITIEVDGPDFEHAVIDIAEHRVVPGTVWWTGLVRCDECGHQHIAIAPMPEWALAPRSGECPSCHAMACLPEREP